MNGPELLEHAAGLVNRRRREYGEPADQFEHVAARWSLTLGTKVSPAQVVLCLIDLKLARLARLPYLIKIYKIRNLLRYITRNIIKLKKFEINLKKL